MTNEVMNPGTPAAKPLDADVPRDTIAFADGRSLEIEGER